MPTSIQRSDLEMHQDAVAELDWDARFNPGEVGIEIDDGIITLRGTVSNYAKLRAAAGLVARIAGVRGVVNDLVVRVPDWYDDLTIAARARMALEMHGDVPNERIECLVRDGCLTLRGSVDHAYQREAARAAVTHIDGFRGLDVEIDIRGHTRSDEDIRRDLHDAIPRRVARGRRVDCLVNNGVVTLSGRLPTLADRLRAEDTAWRTRGVRHVVDHIVVLAD